MVSEGRKRAGRVGVKREREQMNLGEAPISGGRGVSNVNDKRTKSCGQCCSEEGHLGRLVPRVVRFGRTGKRGDWPR